MAAFSSSSTVVDDEVEVGDEVLDLGVASELDPSTFNVFFSDGDGVGKPSWPVAEAIASALTDHASLQDLCHEYGVPNVYKRVCAGRGAASKTPEDAGTNALYVYASALEAGLRFPLHQFYAKLLRHNQLAPSQLTPNSWSYMAAFVRLCEDACVQPQVSVFRYFFGIYAHKDNGVPTGWHHFQPPSPDRRLFTGTDLPKRIGWKSRFFFLVSSSTAPWKCPVKWGKPTRADVRKQQGRNVTIEILQKKAGKDVKKFLSRRGFPVGSLIDQEQLKASMKAEAQAASSRSKSAGKRKAPGDSVTVPALPQQEQGLAELPMPMPLGPDFDPFQFQGTVGDQGGSEGSPSPAPRMWATDMVLLWELQSQKNKLQEALGAANLENDGLKRKLLHDRGCALKALKASDDEITKLKGERALLMERLSAAESKVKQLEKQVSSKVEENASTLQAEHVPSLAKLNEEHAAEVARVKDAAAKEVQAAEARVKKNVMLALFPNGNIDSSLLAP